MALDLLVWAKQRAFQKMKRPRTKKQNMAITSLEAEAKP